jgi:hypothetical protein
MQVEKLLSGLATLRKRPDAMRRRIETLQAELDSLEMAIAAHEQQVGEIIRRTGLLALVDGYEAEPGSELAALRFEAVPSAPARFRG